MPKLLSNDLREPIIAYSLKSDVLEGTPEVFERGRKSA